MFVSISERIYNLDYYNDYSIGGFRLEIFSPIKRIKIRLNDFCTFKSTINDDNQQSIDYKFVRCIGIILPVQQIFDNLQQFDSKFISSQLTSQSQSFPLTDLTDIGSHIKLLVSIDQQSTVETNLWGLRSKLRFNQHDNYKNCQMIKFSGYAIKKGYNFSITLIKSNDRWFINGFSNWGITLVFPIVIATNSQQLIDGDEKINLILGNKYRLFNVIGNQIINSQSFYSITIDGCPGIAHYIRLQVIN
ncbi:uncharacterized protein LOC128395149 [Panonychus citri]|uniref:uncharacterized protein LOC128395149 n=1 Tax=Panonychus citri TaxID=50023 RepID=UPI0023072F33|nr:uncharacterized protein LOC128395149 [Panonychus citri]